MAQAGETGGGLFASLERLLQTGLAIGQNRLELLLVELREERWRFFDLLLLTGLVLLLAGMTLMVATVTIVAVCLQADRLDLILWLMGLYLAGTIASFWRLRCRLKNWAPLSATLAELKKDAACLGEKN